MHENILLYLVSAALFVKISRHASECAYGCRVRSLIDHMFSARKFHQLPLIPVHTRRDVRTCTHTIALPALVESAREGLSRAFNSPTHFALKGEGR